MSTGPQERSTMAVVRENEPTRSSRVRARRPTTVSSWARDRSATHWSTWPGRPVQTPRRRGTSPAARRAPLRPAPTRRRRTGRSAGDPPPTGAGECLPLAVDDGQGQTMVRRLAESGLERWQRPARAIRRDQHAMETLRVLTRSDYDDGAGSVPAHGDADRTEEETGHRPAAA